MRREIAIILTITALFGGSGCSENDPSPFIPFVDESFPNLDIQTVASLETPYETVFSSSSGGRLTGEVTLADISAKLVDIFSGAELLEAEKETERGLAVWKIKLKMPGGGILKLAFVQELGEILKMEGKSGPFTYDVDPGGDFIKLSEAFSIAITGHQGEVVKWELSLEEENRWEYEIHLENSSGRYEVEINAFTGELLDIKVKGENDDREDENEDHETTISDGLANYVHGFLAGEIIHAESEEGDSGWKIYIKTSEGAVVEFRISSEPFSIQKIEGEKGPFSYNIEPGEDRISFGAAKEIALNHTSGEIEEWQLFKDGDLWIYELEIGNADGTFEVEINAITGEII